MEIPFRADSLERFIFWVGAAALLVPTAYIPWFLYPYIFGRAVFFQLAVEAMAVAWIFLLIQRPERYRPRWHLLGKAMAVFVFIALLASLFGVDPGRSVWGTELRMTGWFTWLHAFFYFLILSSVIIEDRHWRRLFVISSVVIGGMTLLAFGERFSPAIRAAIFGGERVQSTAGNPIFFASVLLFGIAFAGWLVASAKGWKRAAWGVVALAEVLALFFTETRGAILAFIAAGAILIVIAAVISSSKRIRHWLAAVLVLIVLLGGALYLIRGTDILRRLPPLWRLANTNLVSGTSRTRLITWQIALDGIKTKPILGWGLENFNVVFDRFYRPELLRYGFYETVSDKPHNGLLEIGVTTGVLGLLVYLLVFAAAGTALVRGFRSGRIDGKTAASVGGALAAYQIQNFFAMDTPESLVLLAFTLAFLQSRLRPPSLGSHRATSVTQVPVAALAVLFLGFIPFSYLGNLAALPGSWEAGQAQDVVGKDAALWKDPAIKAIRLGGPHRREMRLTMTRDFLNWEGRGDMPSNVVKDVLDGFIAEMRKSTATRSVTFQERFMLAQLLIIKGEYFKDEQAYSDAEAELFRAKEQSPERQAAVFLLGRLYIMTDKPEKAVELLRGVLEKDSTVAEAHWFYGLGLIATGKRAEGTKELEEAIRLGRSLSKQNEIQYLIDLYNEEGNFQAIAPLYERLIQLDPKNPDWHARLAATYAELGKNLEAITHAQMAVELDPTYAEAALKFVDSIIKEQE